MPIYRANVVLQGKSGLPEDQYVTTFHFDITADSTPFVDISEGESIATALIDFYNGPDAATSIASFLSTNISRVANDSEVRIYNLSDPPNDRVPHVVQWQLGAAGFPSALNMPGEVALALSYYATNNVPRQRGRVYVGPLSSAVASNDANGVPRPNTGNLNSLVAAGVRLKGAGGADWDWVVWSRPKDDTVNKDGTPNPARPGTAYDITDVWANDEFDVQRRRGAKATVRSAG